MPVLEDFGFSELEAITKSDPTGQCLFQGGEDYGLQALEQFIFEEPGQPALTFSPAG